MRPADEASLAGWDAVAVDGPGGNVLQSLAWGRHRARFGWTPRHLRTDDGLPVLALARPWRLGPGGSAYLSRGPVPAGSPATTAARLIEAAGWLAGDGIDVIAADPEVPADPAFARAVAAAGFHQIEELQPSRHRLDVALPDDGDADALLKSFSATTRNLVRQAQRQDLVVRRIDRRPSPHAAQPEELPAVVDRGAEDARLAALYDLLADTARRRSFWLAGRATFDSWTSEALAAGHLVALLVEDSGGELLAGATFHRQGNRLTYALSGEAESARKASPGATRLLLWQAMRLAMAEGRAIMDLGGVDVRGARRRPRAGEPEHGMLAFKESFGATWVELAGAHERVARPWRYALGRLTGRLGSRAGTGSRVGREGAG
ncbi:MAG TPA: GNAT family N-acetyltransferase, partial [Candidatus Limnocylindrales bacterium]